MLRPTLAFLLTALVLVGCGGTVGRPFPVGATAQLQRGQSTRADVRQLLGDPVSVSTGTAGETWLYLYQNQDAKTFPIPELLTEQGAAPQQSVSVMFEGDVVRDFRIEQNHLAK